MVSSRVMSDLSETYRKKLNAICVARGWVSQKNPMRGSPAELMQKLGRTSSFWSDRLSGRKPISTDLAYEIEDKLGLNRLDLADWAEPPASVWPLSRDVLVRLKNLDGDALRKAENVLRAHLDMAPMIYEENGKAA